MNKCPYPGCEYIAAYAILNSHAREHGYNTSKELFKQHGPAKEASINTQHFREARRNSSDVWEGSYNNIESALARMKKKR